ncbi:linear amide C-N hydrolase [Olivibacter sp. SDN3]|uniref:linear amide C-N hydrolase n=1 Tax=Olivibacter sp. SDN3 TaxID=2764720 RepID=UPI0016511D73|nr:linear amide C-N hydrolase [Olivibacter sp. SDN3]QNL49750.1 linear amide C-N hydrolase [Olivibacter sp. SDN3]
MLLFTKGSFLLKAVALIMVFSFGANLFVPLALACTRVMWLTENGHVYVGRTQDWTERVNSKFRKFPRGISRVGVVAENPAKWTSKYGSFAITGYDIGTHEGVNEKGLSTHLLFLADEASDYGKRDPSIPGLSIELWAQYYLDNFATVTEAVQDIRQGKLQVVPIIFPNGAQSRLHLSLEDKTGNSAIVEYINGKPKVYMDKSYAVMTNEPTYDKQLANLKNYRSFGGNKPLPGERTPMDRFVRASYYTKALPQPANPETAAAYMFSVIRNASVPFGAGEPDKPNVANTIFRTVIDLTNQRYYFESTYAPNVVWVDFSELDYSEGSDEEELAVEQEIFSLNGSATDRVIPKKPFVFGGQI